MTMNLEHQLEMKEIQLCMLLYGLGKKNGKVIPYPSAEYVRSNLLSSPVSNPMYLNISRKFECNAALKGDKSWELLAHWYIEDLAVEGYEKNIPNPLENATVKAKDLKHFLERSHYASPDWLASASGLTNQAISHDTSTADTGQADDDHMEALPADFRALYNAMGAGELPHLDLLIVAWRHFWKDRRPNDGKDYPINPDVAEWVKIRMDNPEQGNSKAKAIASIIRPIWAPTGRQPNRNQ